MLRDSGPGVAVTYLVDSRLPLRTSASDSGAWPSPCLPTNGPVANFLRALPSARSVRSWYPSPLLLVRSTCPYSQNRTDRDTDVSFLDVLASRRAELSHFCCASLRTILKRNPFTQ